MASGLEVGISFRITVVCWQTRHPGAARELVEKSDVNTFVSSKGDRLEYLLTRPLDYDPKKKYPLVVCLPYDAYLAPPAQLLSDNVNRMKYPAFLFVPYCPQKTSWGRVPDKFKMVSLDSTVIEALAA